MKIGNYYAVLCIVTTTQTLIWDADDEGKWLDYDETPKPMYGPHEAIVAVIDHPHNDVENGQNELHYHIDDRFLPVGYNFGYRIRVELPLKDNQKLEYRVLQYVSHEVRSKTPIELIAKSKLKHKCIHKGKCPHRGYDLSKERPKNGIITCPLHGLQFKNKQLITSFENT